MWMLLEHVKQSELEDPGKVVISWSDMIKDNPEDWRGIVSRCLDPDPNEGVGLLELVEFWAAVQRKGRACLPYATMLSSI